MILKSSRHILPFICFISLAVNLQISSYVSQSLSLWLHLTGLFSNVLLSLPSSSQLKPGHSLISHISILSPLLSNIKQLGCICSLSLSSFPFHFSQMVIFRPKTSTSSSSKIWGPSCWHSSSCPGGDRGPVTLDTDQLNPPEEGTRTENLRTTPHFTSAVFLFE